MKFCNTSLHYLYLSPFTGYVATAFFTINDTMTSANVDAHMCVGAGSKKEYTNQLVRLMLRVFDNKKSHIAENHVNIIERNSSN